VGGETAMQAEKQGDQSTGLALFLRDSLGITDKPSLEEFLVQPQSRKLVREASYQDVFFVIKTVGLADSLELLPMTSQQQRRGLIDLDCWRKDNFHLPSFLEWLAAFVHCGPEETVRLARAVDVNVLSLFLKNCIQVHLLDPEEPRPDLPLVLTPDDRFGVEITGEAESASMARLLLDALFRFDPSLGYDLIDRVYWGNRVALEEEAYQDKRRRLEEIGFVDYYDALEIYGEAETKLPTGERVEVERDLTVSSTLPAMFVASLAPGHYLREALQTIGNADEAERISQGLAALANRLLSVYSVTPGDLDKVKPALEEIRDTLNLSLEHLGQGQQQLTGEVLARYDIQNLFKIGFTLVSQLRDQADRVIRQGNLKLRGTDETLLEFPETEFFSGIRRLRPLFFRGIEDPAQVSYRHFQSLSDLQVARRFLSQVEVASRGFWKAVGVSCREFSFDDSVALNLDFKELRFSQIFNTALVNKQQGRAFAPLALSGKDLAEFAKELRVSQLSQLTEWLGSAAQSQVQAALPELEERRVVSMLVEGWVAACAEELFPHLGRRVDPRFIKSLIVRLP
jgi:hypothetical protein